MINVKNSTGYFCEYDEDSITLDVVKVGYIKGKVRSKRGIIVANPQITRLLKSQLFSFLVTMYRAGLNITGKEPLITPLHRVMKQNDLLADYNSIQVLDLVAMLGGIDIDPEDYLSGTKEDRPSVRKAIRENPGNPETLIQMIKFLGMPGFIKNLYGAGAIDFETMKDLFLFFHKDEKEKKQAYRQLIRFIRKKNRTLSFDEVKNLIDG